MFPCYWRGGLPFSVYEPYLILEAASPEALRVAEATVNSWAMADMRTFAKSNDA